jgi:hypothetical protein
MANQKTYSKNPDMIDKKVESGMLLFDTASSRMLELNPTAALLWSKSAKRFSESDLCRIIEENCTGCQDVREDIIRFMENAKKHNMASEDGHERSAARMEQSLWQNNCKIRYARPEIKEIWDEDVGPLGVYLLEM